MVYFNFCDPDNLPFSAFTTSNLREFIPGLPMDPSLELNFKVENFSDVPLPLFAGNERPLRRHLPETTIRSLVRTIDLICDVLEHLKDVSKNPPFEPLRGPQETFQQSTSHRRNSSDGCFVSISLSDEPGTKGTRDVPSSRTGGVETRSLAIDTIIANDHFRSDSRYNSICSTSSIFGNFGDHLFNDYQISYSGRGRSSIMAEPVSPRTVIPGPWQHGDLSNYQMTFSERRHSSITEVPMSGNIGDQRFSDYQISYSGRRRSSMMAEPVSPKTVIHRPWHSGDLTSYQMTFSEHRHFSMIEVPINTRANVSSSCQPKNGRVESYSPSLSKSPIDDMDNMADSELYPQSWFASWCSQSFESKIVDQHQEEQFRSLQLSSIRWPFQEIDSGACPPPFLAPSMKSETVNQDSLTRPSSLSTIGWTLPLLETDVSLATLSPRPEAVHQTLDNRSHPQSPFSPLSPSFSKPLLHVIHSGSSFTRASPLRQVSTTAHITRDSSQSIELEDFGELQTLKPVAYVMPHPRSTIILLKESHCQAQHGISYKESREWYLR